MPSNTCRTDLHGSGGSDATPPSCHCPGFGLFSTQASRSPQSPRDLRAGSWPSPPPRPLPWPTARSPAGRLLADLRRRQDAPRRSARGFSNQPGARRPKFWGSSPPRGTTADSPDADTLYLSPWPKWVPRSPCSTLARQPGERPQLREGPERRHRRVDQRRHAIEPGQGLRGHRGRTPAQEDPRTREA